jgi:N-acyl-D-aspartate/D-glutamate deacylase
MLDLKIINGTVIDGSGRPGIRADVGVRQGRIVAVGEMDEEARKTIDAMGRIVSPGFIDTHTHYDAQVFWDPTLSPSCFHGVTTVLAGFCGFSIAPMTEDAAAYIRPMLARVEGMPLATLESAVPWQDWKSFGDFLARIEGGIGLNAGFFCGHSAIRRIVMGERAVGERATPGELARMKAMLATSLAEGALGFSTTISPTHNDAEGNPVPSRWAAHEELIELAGVVRDYPGTGVELVPDLEFGPGIPELLTQMSLAAQRPVNWNALVVTGRPDAAERIYSQLAVTDYARARGGEVIALAIPSSPNLYMNFANGCGFDSNPGHWREIFKYPLEERLERLKDPTVRKRLADDAAGTPKESPILFFAQISNFRVVKTVAEANRQYEGRLVEDIAAERSVAPIDAMLDIAISDGLLTTFSPNMGGLDDEAFRLRGELWRDDRTLIGASDAGAHLDMIDTFAFSTTVLQQGVREHGVISLEEAVHQMTERQARYMGLIDRGLVAPGYHADLVVFDAATVGCDPSYMRQDVPGGQFRIYADARGIDHVFVNGVQIVREGEHTGALPGVVLHSGRDTCTMPMNALATGSSGAHRE